MFHLYTKQFNKLNIFGEMAERFNALVLKTNVKKFTEGSNPSLSCIIEEGFYWVDARVVKGGGL